MHFAGPPNATTTATGSLWLTGPVADSDPLPASGRRFDVCVIGGGIVGVSVALLQARRGRDVVLLERGRIGGGVTGATTGKVSLLHSLRYADLVARHDRARMTAYVELQRAGFALTRAWAGEIPGAWETRDAVSYVRSAEHVGDVEREGEALVSLGVEVRPAPGLMLEDGFAAGLVLPDQGKLHSVRYTAGVAAQARAHGAIVVAGAPVVKLRRGDGGHRVVLEGGTHIDAEHVVVATHAPIFDRGAHFALQEPMRSYAIATPVAEPPTQMSYCQDEPSRSVMGHTQDGTHHAVVGGEGHPAGRSSDDGRFARLESWAAEHLGGQPGPAPYRWSAQDLIPVDGLPLIGLYVPGARRLWTATGFAKWGLAAGTGAAAALDAAIAGEPSQAAAALRPWRPTPRASGPSLIKNNVLVQRHMIGDRLSTLLRGGTPPEALEPGEGRVERIGGRPVAVARDADGIEHRRSAACTHLGCEVRFNRDEQSWDCPCHGSRFAIDGSVLEGPAVNPLAPAHEA